MRQLDRIEDKLDHLHEILHSIAHTLADVARAVVPGSIAPADHNEILARLLNHAAKLESIAAAVPPVPPR